MLPLPKPPFLNGGRWVGVKAFRLKAGGIKPDGWKINRTYFPMRYMFHAGDTRSCPVPPHPRGSSAASFLSLLAVVPAQFGSVNGPYRGGVLRKPPGKARRTRRKVCRYQKTGHQAANLVPG